MSTIFGYAWEEIQARQMKTYRPKPIVTVPGKDYGADPVGDGTFRMVPSGDVVDYAERCKRLA